MPVVTASTKPGMVEWAKDAKQPWTTLKFNQFGLHAVLAVKTITPSPES